MHPPAPGDCFLVTQIPGPYHVRGVLLFHVPSFRLRWIFIILRPCHNRNVCLYVKKADGTEGGGPFPHTQRAQSLADSFGTGVDLSRGYIGYSDYLEVARTLS
jgi:hypothetical protein